MASSLNEQGFMDEPMCLIENKRDQNLYVNQEALEILKSFKQPLVVVAIVGTYRTGKSYLMNRLAGKSKGFALGATVEATTKGIWMWCCKHPEKPDHVLVLLDSEGMGDVEKSNTENDSWIFALSVLLCSTFVYNSMNTIDHCALERLHYVAELCEHIKVKTTTGQSWESDDEFLDDFVWYFPTFIWTVRDFALQLKLEGQPITEDEYLENALRTRQDVPEEQDLIKRCLREYFPSRKCFIFDRPALSRSDLERLDDLPESKLSSEFLEQAESFCQYIYKNAEPKMVPGGRAVTGTLLGSLAVTYVDVIRSGAVPCIENAVVTLAKIENSAAVIEALKRYDDMVVLLSVLPAEMEDILQVHARCEEEAIQVFLDRAFMDENHEYQKQLGNELHARLLELCSRNTQVSSDRCQAVLMELFQNLEEDVRNGIYAVPGGYQRFLEEQQKLLTKYDLLPDKGVMASTARYNYLESKEAEMQAILHTDQNLTAKEKEAAVEKAKAEAAEREAELQRRQREEAERMAQEQARSFQEHQRQLEIKMEQDRRELIARQEAILTQRLQAAQRDQEARSHGELAGLRQQLDQLRCQQNQPPRRGSDCVVS